jgi:hypothetical protein
MYRLPPDEEYAENKEEEAAQSPNRAVGRLTK